MTRRASLPGVDELFRSSKPAEADSEAEETNRQEVKETPAATVAPAAPAPVVPAAPPVQAAAPPPPVAPAVAPVVALPAPVAAPALPSEPAAPASDAGRRPRHEEKVTFYCTASELTRIERARLALRADHRLGTDRGRIVRAALAEILDDFEQRGDKSLLVARLRELSAE